MTSARVSVVMPCFNAAGTVAASVRSVQAQTVGDWQLVVVDDGSSDATVAVIASLGEPRIRLIRQSNAGVSAARNRALREVTTPYVAFLDADDTWAPGFLQSMLDALTTDPAAALAYCGWEDVHTPPRQNRAHDPPDFEAAGAHRLALLLRRCPWVIHAAMTRTEAIREAGGFDPRFAVAEDYLLWLRVAARRRIVKVPGCMAFYRHDSSRPQATQNVLRVMRQTRGALTLFLGEEEALARGLPVRLRRELLYGASLQAAYAALWSRDLATAQDLFRDCFQGRHLGRRDLKYALPALLPAAWFRRLVARRDQKAPASPV